ncbi:MAG: redoxin family protein [Pyrinomonadaceae bacterium]
MNKLGTAKSQGLRGRVVLIEFWTFGCYNCRNTLPYVKGWDDRYRAKGFTVIGVHSPEFDDERKTEHLRREVASLGIMYPVVTDNDYQMTPDRPDDRSAEPGPQ